LHLVIDSSTDLSFHLSHESITQPPPSFFESTLSSHLPISSYLTTISSQTKSKAISNMKTITFNLSAPIAYLQDSQLVRLLDTLSSLPPAVFSSSHLSIGGMSSLLPLIRRTGWIDVFLKHGSR
jgi:hypothetical protein